MSLADPNPVLFERAPEAILVLNRDGQVLDLNREARRTLAVDGDRLVGRPILATVVPDDRERVKDLFLRVLGGQECTWIARFKRGDGVTRVQWVRAAPVTRSGAVEGIVMFTKDVTESRSGRPETFQLQTLLENLPGQVVAVVSREGIVRYSTGLSRTHFRDDIDAIGTPYVALLEPYEENERLLSEMLDEVMDGRHWAGTHWHRRVDGTLFPLRTYASPYLDPRSGRVLGALVAGRDVGAEYDWRERAGRAQRLAGIGGLVNSVLEQIGTSVKRVQAVLGYGAPGEEAVDATSVPTELARLAGLADALHEFASDVKLERESVSVPALVREVLAGLDEDGRTRGIGVRVIPGEEIPAVQADPHQIRRLLEILLRNALDALDGVERPSLRVSFNGGRDVMEVRVADSGPGIREEDAHRIFEPLFTTRKGHLGLGLAVAREIVQAHGGRMWTDRDEDGGWTVVVAELPLRPPDSTVRFRPVPLALTRNRSVLVVDDDDAVRSGLRRFLEKVGFEVREAWSGRSALAQITVSRPPELALTDLKMADGTGAWFLDQLSRDFPDLLRHTVIVTGEADRAEVERVTRDTNCPVLRKPLEFPQLLDVLDEVALRE